MEGHEQVFDILFNQDEITWQSIIYDLVKTEQMDPWDVDITLLTKRYLEMVKKIKETDFRISGKVLLAAAILLKMKSNRLVGDANQLEQMFNEPEAEELYDELEEEFQKMTGAETPVLIPRTPQPRKRKVSIYDLVGALNKALEVKQRRVLNNIPPINVEIPKKKRDITEIIGEVYSNVKSFFSKSKNKLTFSSLLPSQSKEDKDLSETLKQYETIVRWAQWDAAVNFISNEYQEEHPITRLEMDRLRLFRVTQYILRSSTPVDDGMGLRQTVELHIFNKNQARERTIIDEQYWKYNEERERWLLHSGLPDPTQRDY